MTQTPSPLVQRRRLRTELRRARAEAGKTQDQVAKAMDWSLSKIIRIEAGAVTISTNDLRALLILYQINDEERTDELIEIARVSRQPSWWAKYRKDISPQYLQYIEYEEAASIVRTYDPLLLPGLIQTEKYAEVVFDKLADPAISADLNQARLEIRLARQQLLEQESPPDFFCVIDEGAIQRAVGERNIALAQVDRLSSLAVRPNVTIEIIPFAVGLHPGMLEPFNVLEFPDPEDSDVLFVETSRDMIISHDQAGVITGYRETFESLRGVSLGAEETLAYLQDLARGLA